LVCYEYSRRDRALTLIYKLFNQFSIQAIGTLARESPVANAHLSGLLVAKDYSYTLLDPSDLRDFTGLSTSAVIQRMKVYLGVGFDLVKWHLEGMYGMAEEGRDGEGNRVLRVRVFLIFGPKRQHALILRIRSFATPPCR
jgi:cleavage and polyadenylation specificity factor subunit 3